MNLRALFFVQLFVFSALAWGQTPSPSPSDVEKVEVTPSLLEVEVGQDVQFTAVAKDKSGRALPDKPSKWFSSPFEIAGSDENGRFHFVRAGTVRVGAIIGGKPGTARVLVRQEAVARIDVDLTSQNLYVGDTYLPMAIPRTWEGNPLHEVGIQWISSVPQVAYVDSVGVVHAIAPGTSQLKAVSKGVSSQEITLNVQPALASTFGIEPSVAEIRTGDVIHFKIAGEQTKLQVRWTISGNTATMTADGAFVAEKPGTYIVAALAGGHIASTAVHVKARGIRRQLELVGRAFVPDVQFAEQWIFGKYAYLSTISDRLFVYDISNPSLPKLTETLKVDARIINDVSITPDGSIGVITREGASDRKNGIIFLDTTDLAHPKILSQYTATVTGGVHSAYIYGKHVFITDDATGSMRVIDFQDVKAPKEVARWQVQSPLNESQIGRTRYLHDLQVVNGIAYLAYWRDGLVILDVGNGIKGGSPENPKFVSQFRLNYGELYGGDWVAGSHAVFRYKNYVFIGDEVLSTMSDIFSKERVPARGAVHVIDVSDLEHPKKVAEYQVPEAGSHNVWVEDDLLYMGYYGGGARILDVSGELLGDLYKQGREVASYWTGSAEGFRPNLPFTWGAQPYGGLIYFNDINSGLWIMKLGHSKD